MPISEGTAPDSSLLLQTIYPIGVYTLSGLAVSQGSLLAIDCVRGYLLEIDPRTNNTTILNPHHVEEWINATGLAIRQNTVWYAKDCQVLSCERDNFCATVFAELPYKVDGLAVWGAQVYVSCQKSGYIHVFDRTTGELSQRFAQPGVGPSSLTIQNGVLWACDHTEQTVYCLDRKTGAIRYSALTPFASPVAIAFYPVPDGQETLCYVAYSDEQPYIRDDPNAEQTHQLTFRDRSFIHPLHIARQPKAHYTLSNGYRVEMSYVEEMLPLDPVDLENVEWRIALPSDTLRQKVCHVEPIGHPCTIEEQNGQRVAVFKFDHLKPYQAGLVGWKAIVEMYSLKYHLHPEDIAPVDGEAIPPELQAQYLVDNDELAMDTITIREAAKAAIGTETNVLRQMLRIRNYVYDRLAYGIQPKIDTPDVALERGVASCGEYVGVLLALARLNGIPCRTVGRYKCPPYPEQQNLPLAPDFNHVWLEFYVPGMGWLPMESNVDDVVERGPYPTRFFMGLSWYHMELGKGIKFQKLTADNLPEDFALGDLAINHIRFRILEELLPTPLAKA